jgi:hypothetical protein
MFFRQRAAAHASLSYLFGCAGVGKAVAVDVLAGDEDWFIAEAALNPMLALPRKAFVDALVAQLPPKAPGMDDIVATNLRGVLPHAAGA